MRGAPQREGAGRAVVYCVVPRDLAAKLHEPLRRHFGEQPDAIEVVVERRGAERRSNGERRMAAAPARERRRIRNAEGRRVGERRAPLLPLDAVPLPWRARPHAARLAFVERVEPSGEHAEDLDSARLVTRFQSGDADAFAALYIRYFDRIYGYLRVALGNYHDAEEGCQQVFAQVCAALPRYERRHDQPFRGWLYIVARNYAIARLKKDSRMELMDPAEIGAHRELAEEANGEPPAFDWITDSDLLILIGRLPAAQRQVLAFRYLLGMSIKEIAEILEIPSNHVSVLQYRALGFLRKRLTALGRVPSGRRRAPMRTRFQQAPVLRYRRFILNP